MTFLPIQAPATLPPISPDISAYIKEYTKEGIPVTNIGKSAINFAMEAVKDATTYAQKLAQDDSIIIYDWKNHQVYKGDIYQITFDVSPVLSKLFTAVNPLIGSIIPIWMYGYWRNAGGWTRELINKILSYSSTMGVMKNKIEILDIGTGFSNDYTTFKLTFRVLENAWPLFFVVGAILAVCAFLTVREVRLMKNPPLVTAAGIAGWSWPFAIVAATALAIFIIPKISD